MSFVIVSNPHTTATHILLLLAEITAAYDDHTKQSKCYRRHSHPPSMRRCRQTVLSRIRAFDWRCVILIVAVNRERIILRPMPRPRRSAYSIRVCTWMESARVGSCISSSSSSSCWALISAKSRRNGRDDATWYYWYSTPQHFYSERMT